MLMKLVMTMSKDEIFIRSQNIMNEQKKKELSNKTKSWVNFGSRSSKPSVLSLNQKLPVSNPKQLKGVKQRKQQMSQLQNKKKINKSEIGNPVPISIPKKFAVSVEDLLEGIETHPVSGSTRSKERRKENLNDSYMSCSECGYQSLCGSVCSCSVAGKGEKKKRFKHAH